MKKLTTTQKKNNRQAGRCENGPWQDKRLIMPSNGDDKTAIITVGEFHGYYKRVNSGMFKWYDVRKRG